MDAAPYDPLPGPKWRRRAPYFLRHFHEADGPAPGCLKKSGEIEPSLAAIRGGKEGPVNWRRAARDFRAIHAGAWPIAAAPDGPLFGP